jgi:hypothetical protein
MELEFTRHNIEYYRMSGTDAIWVTATINTGNCQTQEKFKSGTLTGNNRNR